MLRSKYTMIRDTPSTYPYVRTPAVKSVNAKILPKPRTSTKDNTTFLLAFFFWSVIVSYIVVILLCLAVNRNNI